MNILLSKNVLSRTFRMFNTSYVSGRAFALSNREAAFRILKLNTFTDNEIANSFTSMKNTPTDKTISLNESIVKLCKLDDDCVKFEPKRVAQISRLVVGRETQTPFTYDMYKKSVTDLAERLDPRVWHIGLSFLFTGTSVGIIIPCMPLLVSQLNMPSSEFGLVIAAFGLSKLLGNIPSGYLVEKYGRKPMLVAGLGMCSVGLASIGLTLLPGFGTSWLVACRFLSGLGVSAFVAGGHMFMSDISTPLNRARTIAPVMAGFSAGAALGPAVGGLLIDWVGISATYGIVGGLFGSLALMNFALLTETIQRSSVPITPPTASPSGAQPSRIVDSFRVAFESWRHLVSNKQLQNTVFINGAYWFAYAGTQMTLLPLFMVSPLLQLSAYEIGGCFAFMSVIAFVTAQPSAYLADKFGKHRSILLGSGLVASSVLAMPLAHSLPALVAVMSPLAMGATMLNSTPTALVSDLTSPQDRAQAMSLLRTAGDLGLLLGAGCSGLLAHYSSLETAMLVNGAVMTASMAWYAARHHWAVKGESKSL